MKVLLQCPSGCGKSTAHEGKLSLDIEELDIYRARKEHYDWNKPVSEGGVDTRKIRGAYWEAATAVALKSNFPIVATHPVLGGETAGRRPVRVVVVPDWQLAGDEDRFTRERLVAMAMGYAKMAILQSDDKATLVEGYVSDVVNDHFKAGTMSADEWDLEIERLEHSIQEAFAPLDKQHGFTEVSQ